MIDFLMDMYRILLTCESRLLQQSVTSAFVNKDWARQVKERGTKNMIDMLNRDMSAQKTGMGKLRFWRNCIEHMKRVQNISIYLHIITIIFVAL